MVRAVAVMTIATTVGLADHDTRPAPNFVLIVADDLGYGQLGCYGQDKIRTPSLDRMAREGTRFTQFYAGHCVCAPSRSVLMTGHHTGHTSVRINGGGSALLPEDGTLAEIVKQAGYTTGCYPRRLESNPTEARRFFLKYADRILFGVDRGSMTRYHYRVWFRFLETQDEYFPFGGNLGRWNIYGIYLPDDVLKKIYHQNALRLLRPDTLP